MSFSDIAIEYLKDRGYEPHICKTEDEARGLIKTLPEQGKWPCLFTTSDTTGEKDFEEFYTEKEALDMERFSNLGVIKNEPEYNENQLNDFESNIGELKASMKWSKKEIVGEFFKMIPEFNYHDNGKYLDGKM
jgi:hypothetical protein